MTGCSFGQPFLLYLVYFPQKASKRADKIWDEKTYSNKTMDEWLNEE